jgi:hypothetical protein
VSVENFLGVKAIDVYLMSTKQRKFLNKVYEKPIDFLEKVSLSRK